MHDLCLLASSMLFVRFDRPDDLIAIRVDELISTFDQVPSVSKVTHDRSGILGVAVTREEDASAVDVFDIGLPDHRLLTWWFHVAVADVPAYKTQSRRTWKAFDADAFKKDVDAFSLCSPLLETDCPSQMVRRFDEVIGSLLDAHPSESKSLGE